MHLMLLNGATASVDADGEVNDADFNVSAINSTSVVGVADAAVVNC